VGHEIDVTIADLVADRRALTPTEAAELAVPCREDYVERLRQTELRLKSLMEDRCASLRKRLGDLAQRHVFREPLERIRALESRLDEQSDVLERAIRRKLTRWQEHLQTQAARLEALSPLNVLARGYSVTRRETDQAVVRTPEQVGPGDRLVTQVRDGRIVSRVEETGSA
jgi:exodeoxyribonuclease VII large subunit